MNRRMQDLRRREVQRIGRQVTFDFRRLAGDDDLTVKAIHPDAISPAQASATWDYVRLTPNRWHLEFTVYCVDQFGQQYSDTIETDTVQACHYEGLHDYREQCFERLKAPLNHNHIWAYGFTMRII